ncbi:MAG: 3-dehydroquinate synthase [Gemmatimonadota bacterium]|nr:MAG: 3-dehydroquinate synthase [Gemmatimonadota bacterium]
MNGQEHGGHRTTVKVKRDAEVVSYDVWVRPGMLDDAGAMIGSACPADRYAIIADTQVAELYGERTLAALEAEGLKGALLKFPAGEWNKTRESWSELGDGMLRAGFGRDAAVIVLGGGVAGDLGGFVAATFMRGVPLIQIPTTLLAMLDSSVGGMTGVDTPAGKNLVGAFHQPALVLADPAVLTTLPAPQFASGLAEAFKHGLILDAAYFESIADGLEDLFARDPERLSDLIARSVEIKAEVMSRDEWEGGYRRVLNFGHTLASAQEAISGYAWLHGEAVAAGMALEAAIGEAAGVTRPGVSVRVREVLEAARLPVALDQDADPTRFFEALERAGKREGGQVRYTLLVDIGLVAGSDEGSWTHPVPEELVRAVLFDKGR